MTVTINGTGTGVFTDASGNFSVRTATPTAPVTVGRVDSSNEGGQIDLCRASDNASSWAIDVYGNTSTPSFRIVDNVAAAARMVIDGSGNVGIGTSSPAAKLDVVGNIKIGGYNILGGANNSSVNLAAGTAFNTGGASVALRGISNGYNNGGMEFYTGSGATGAEVMRIDSSGRLLVGITSGTSKLTVVATSQVGHYLSTSDTNDMMFLVGNKGGNSSTAFYVMPIRAGSTETFVGGIRYSGSVVEYNTSSDYRLKENVQQMSGGLDRIMRLKPCTYTWKEQKVYGEGFIAHELQDVIPTAASGEKDAVNEDGSIRPQSVDYSKIVVHLVAAIQEQQAQIEELKAKVAALEAK